MDKRDWLWELENLEKEINKIELSIESLRRELDWIANKCSSINLILWGLKDKIEQKNQENVDITSKN